MFDQKEFSSTTEKRKWAELMDISYMSSEESEGEDTIIIRPLAWLTEEVNQFKKSLDDARYSAQTPQAKRQMKKRTTGDNSLREKPSGSDWIFTESH